MNVVDPITTVASADPHGREPVSAYPPRFGWLKRLPAAGAALVVLVLMVRLAWGYEADRRLRLALAPAAARGEPIWPADFAPAGGAGGDAAHDNAALVLRAADAVDWTGLPSRFYFDVREPYLPHSPYWYSQAETAVVANAQALSLARQARAFDHFNLDVPFASATVTARKPSLRQTKMLADVLGDAALFAHESGDDSAALEVIRDALHAAATLRSHPLLRMQALGVGMEAVALERLNAIGPRLRIGSADGALHGGAITHATKEDERKWRLARRIHPFGPNRPAPPRAVSHETVRALAVELLDTRAQARNLARSFAGERALLLSAAEAVGTRGWLLRPLRRLDAGRLMHGFNGAIDAALQPDWPAAQRVLARQPTRLSPRLPRHTEILVSGLAPATGRGQYTSTDFTRLLGPWYTSGLSKGGGIQKSFRVAADRRMAAVGLAAQAYRAEHGRWPTTIDELVPHYLPKIPVDPMAADGARLRYVLLRGALPDGRDRPLVYSAGGNGVFNPPEKLSPPKAPVYGWTNNTDEWRDLERW